MPYRVTIRRDGYRPNLENRAWKLNTGNLLVAAARAERHAQAANAEPATSGDRWVVASIELVD